MTTPIKLGDSGDNVRVLHSRLYAAGFSVDAAEVRAERFGPSTRDAVVALQGQLAVPATGEFDKRTADALSKREKAGGVGGTGMAAAKVKSSKKAPVGATPTPVAVSAAAAPTAPPGPAASSATESNELTARPEIIDQGEAQIKHLPAVSSDSGTRTQSNVASEVQDQKQGTQTMTTVDTPNIEHPHHDNRAHRAVHGKITDKAGAPRVGLTAKAFDRNVGEDDTLLGQATTDAHGKYSVSYTLEQLQGKPAADLVVSIFQDAALLRTSDVIFNAKPAETLDFSIPVPEKPEFQALTERIQPLLRNKTKLDSLDTKQAEFLGKKLDVDAKKISRLAQSHALAGDDKTLATFYYGMLSQNQSVDPAALLRRPKATLQTALSRAAIFNQIPRLQPADVDTILNTTLPKLRAENLLKPAAAGQKASLGDMLKTMPQPLSNDLQMKVADIVAQNGINYKKLPDLLKSADFSEEQAIGIVRTLQLSDVTLSHPTLTQHLQQLTATDPLGSLKSLTALGRDKWIDLAHAHGTPAGIDQKPETYAKQLEAGIEAMHPTAMLAARINSGELVIKRPGFENAGTYLANNPDIDIVYTNLALHAAKANFNGVANKDRLLKSMQKLQRIKRLSASWDETGAMLNAGLESILDIVGAGQSRLTKNLAGKVAPERVSHIYQQARKVHDVSLMLMSGALPRFAPTPIAAMGGATRAKALSAAKANYTATAADSDSATLPSLFGALDTVAYDQTVLSPSAYLVDLLQFINVRMQKDELAGETVLNVLLQRRPDLVDLQLSSDNTNIELPIIDLVLEILENTVALPYPLDLGSGTNWNAALNNGTVPDEVAGQLQLTSLGTIGSNLKVTTEDDQYQRSLTNDVGDIWIVNDGQRRWCLTGTPQPMTVQFSDPITAAFNLPLSYTAEFFGELTNNPPITDDILAQLDALFQLDNTKYPYLYLSISNVINISTTSPDLQWNMDCCLGVYVYFLPVVEEVQEPDGTTNIHVSSYTLVLSKTPSGADHPVLEGLSGDQRSAMEGELNKHSMPTCTYDGGPWSLADLLNPASNLVYSIDLYDNPNFYKTWFISLTEPVHAVVTYQPDPLEIKSIAYQTVGNSDDLIACPENQNPIAYEILRDPQAYGKPVFPWSLPFNLPWESVRACLSRAGVSRQQLMELVKPVLLPNSGYLNPRDTGWVCEILGISTEEAKLIVTSVSDQEPLLWSYWGLTPNADKDWNDSKVYDAEAGVMEPGGAIPSGDPATLLCKVSILIQQARISYEDMLSILETYYVGASTKFNIIYINPDPPNGDYGPCNLFISSNPNVPADLTPGLTAPQLDRIHRFIRLWRELGWEIADLDRAINLLDSNQDISEGLLSSLAHIVKLRQLLDVPASVLINWWGDLRKGGSLLACIHSDVKSLYEQVFLNPLVQNPPDSDFLLNAERAALLNNGNATLSEKSQILSAALGFGQNDFSPLLTLLEVAVPSGGRTRVPGVSDELTLPNLFEFYRNVGLMQALGISISDYISIVSMTAAEPFSDTLNLVEFCQIVQFIQNSGFSVQELAYLLEQDTSAAKTLDLTNDQVSQMLRTIRSAMQAKLSSVEPQVRNIIANNAGGPTIIAVQLSPDASVAADAAALAVGFAPGDSISSVTSDVVLLPKGINGTNIQWNSSDTSLIEDSTGSCPGKVMTRPSVDTPVTLTATISMNGASSPTTMSFTVTVLAALTGDQALAADTAAISIGFVHQGDIASGVTGDLILPVQGRNGASIAWSTPVNQTALQVDATGTVGTITRPLNGNPDVVATLKATVSMPGASAPISKPFTVVVLADLTDAQAVLADAASLAIEFQPGDNDSSVTGSSLCLPTGGANSTAINWTIIRSNIADVITITNPTSPPPTPTSAPLPTMNAAVTRPALGDSNAYVVLSATVTRNGAPPATRVFFPKTLLGLPTLNPDRLAIVLNLTDPNNQNGLNVNSLLSDVIVGQVAGLFSFEATVARQLLSTVTSPQGLVRPAILNERSDRTKDAIVVFFDKNFVSQNGQDTPDACSLMHQLQKASLLFSRLKAGSSSINWITPPYGMQTLDLNQLPLPKETTAAGLFSSWQQLVTLFQIRDQIPGMANLLGQYVAELSALLQPPPPSSSGLPILRLPPLPGMIGVGLGLPSQPDWNYIAGQLGMSSLSDFGDPLKLQAFVNLLCAMKKLGATWQDLTLLTQVWPDPDPNHLATQAETTARALLRAKYGANSWDGIIKPISDVLRTRQRDVLVDFLIHELSNSSQGLPIRNTDDLYEHLLIDTQMSPAMLTSRLVQATAAVQLFVQRCLLNLEPEVPQPAPDSSDSDYISATQWEWMKNYRVWEANREVFLYPENWLYPELRDDKTETFEALESGISQGEPNDQLAQSLLLEYMDDIGELAKIKVLGIYEYVDTDETGDVESTLYIVGRTPDQPYSHYWRKCPRFGDPEMQWTGWEKVDLDISDDHVMPFVFEGDLCIAWPTITQKSDISVTTVSTATPDAGMLWEIKVNWARYTGTGWTKKKVSKDAMPLAAWNAPINCQPSVNDSEKELTFRLQFDETLNRIRFQVFQVAYDILNPPTGASSTGLFLPAVVVGPNPDKNPEGPVLFHVCLFNTWDAVNSNGELTTYYLAEEGVSISIDLTLASKQNPSINGTHLILNAADPTDSSGNCEVWLPADFYSTKYSGFLLPYSQYITGVTVTDADSGGVIGKWLNSYVNGDVLNSPPSEWYACIRDQSFTCSSVFTPKPIGQFILSAYEDIELDNTSFPLPSDLISGANPYANGNVEPADAKALDSLTLPTSNSWNAEMTVFSNIPDGFFAIKAAQQAIDDLPTGCLLDDAWYYEDCWTKMYLKVEWNDSNPGDYAVVTDNMKSTANLRSDAYMNWDNFYTPGEQNEDDCGANFAEHYLTYGTLPFKAGSMWISQGILFHFSDPSSLYNWEIFYHAPMLIAQTLTKLQRFSDARKWLHYVFNPTKIVVLPKAGGAARFWQFLPFRSIIDGGNLQGLFEALAEAQSGITDPNVTSTDLSEFQEGIETWKEDPFEPFAVARMSTRWAAFQWGAIFAYLDNLIAWGDQLFQQCTRESVNEAIQYYILASKLLGPRPLSIKSQTEPPAQSYRDLYRKWDKFSNAWYSISDSVSAVLAASGASSTSQRPGPIVPSDSEPVVTLTSLGMLYFGIPANDKLTGYWDTVEDRLFKIRNCMNIDGITQELPLFSPPIDPLLLIQAAAAGLDISDALADLDAPPLPYRFNILVQKASEVCAEVKSLGAALLAALEKNDAEGLALLRSGQEVALLNLVTQVKQRQVDEANANIDSLNQSVAVAMARFTQYQNLLGNTAISVDSNGLPVLPSSSALQVAANAPGDEAGLGLIQQEVEQFASLDSAQSYQEQAGWYNLVAGCLHAIPELQTGWLAEYVHIGGTHFGNAASAIGAYESILAGRANHDATRQGMLGSYRRRQDEWVFQSKLALEDIKQINKQIIAAKIRLDIAQKELDNHLKQVDNAQAVDDYMHDKYTNQALYSWMMGQVSSIYFTCYQLAYDTAKRAEKAFQNELGLAATGSTFIQYGYWNSLKKGLLAGENLSLDLKRMEIAYLEQNQRELEITRHVSLRQLDPWALLSLKLTGKCDLSLPEALFDLDFPGQYFRRIKSVGLSIPCVAGPYTSVSCTLTLNKHSYRCSSAVDADGYARKTNAQGIPADDTRFVDNYFVSMQSVATSSGQNDSGLFELNFRDERYLPFEGAGAISSWSITLPDDFRQFDYYTISDVILHVRYTARQGIPAETVTQSLIAQLKDVTQTKLGLFFSLRHDFPTEWATFVNNPSADFAATIQRNYFPYIAQDTRSGKLSVTEIDLFAQDQDPTLLPQPLTIDFASATRNLNLATAAFPVSLANYLINSSNPNNPDPNKDVFMIIRYTLG